MIFRLMSAEQGYAEKAVDVYKRQTDTCLASVLHGLSHAVIPGFYGANPDGTVRTFSRGGSDVTGSIVAKAINAELYENWTDVNGFLIADPRIVDEPKVIESITYKELRELSYICLLYTSRCV